MLYLHKDIFLTDIAGYDRISPNEILCTPLFTFS